MARQVPAHGDDSWAGLFGLSECCSHVRGERYMRCTLPTISFEMGSVTVVIEWGSPSPVMVGAWIGRQAPGN